VFFARGTDVFEPFEVLTPVIRVMNLLRFVIFHVLFLSLNPLYAVLLRGPGHLFGPFSTLGCLLALLSFVFWYVVGESTNFPCFDYL
jgi:hypothetical protein